MTSRAFDTPETQDPLRPVCLATSVRYVMKQDTVIRTLIRSIIQVLELVSLGCFVWAGAECQ
jgi:hypothetical protein